MVQWAIYFIKCESGNLYYAFIGNSGIFKPGPDIFGCVLRIYTVLHYERLKKALSVAITLMVGEAPKDYIAAIAGVL